MYLLFTYEGYYPRGAAGDFSGTTETLEGAVQQFRRCGYEWSDVLHIETMKWWQFRNREETPDGEIVFCGPYDRGERGDGQCVVEAFNTYRAIEFPIRASFECTAVVESCDVRNMDIEITFHCPHEFGTMARFTAEDGTELARVDCPEELRWVMYIDGTETELANANASQYPRVALTDGTKLVWETVVYHLKAPVATLMLGANWRNIDLKSRK